MSSFRIKLTSVGGGVLLSAIALLLLLPVVAVFTGNSYAETVSRLESGVDALERQLEMGRHKQLTALKIRPDSVLAEFTTDGCSGGLSVGWQFLAGKIKSFQSIHGTVPPWESCCIGHDQEYHLGGGREITAGKSFEARREADLALRICVHGIGLERAPGLSRKYNVSAREVKNIYIGIADLMYRAVRMGGMPCTGLPWRWGYGWPECE